MIIAVASGKGGTGKTTVAVNLALTLAAGSEAADGRLLFLDCDVEEPNAALFLQPVITQREEVGILVPQVDLAKCTACGRCAEVCAYHALAVVGQKVDGQMGGLGVDVAQATDLHQLKDVVSQRLNQIKREIDDYLEEESAWHNQAESSEKALRERLAYLERESSDLRARMLEAHHMALLDTVTGLPNRLAYEERIQQELARWKRFGNPLTMLIWDVDDFKSINDRFGHQAGDKALKVIAQSLKSRIRETDFIARFGGEEFVCLLCGSAGEEALTVAEEMRRSVESNGFHSQGKPVPVTISCGVAGFQPGDDLDSVFASADKALYQAKSKGKNRCELA